MLTDLMALLMKKKYRQELYYILPCILRHSSRYMVVLPHRVEGVKELTTIKQRFFARAHTACIRRIVAYTLLDRN